MLGEIRTTLVRNSAEVLDDIILNADITPNNNINAAGATISKTTAGKGHWLLGFDGLIHLPLVDNTAMANNHNANANDDMFNEIRARMGRYGVRPSELVWITDVNTFIRAQAAESFRTMDKLGPNATILTGMLGAVEGIPVIVSEQMRLANADGKVPDASNTRGVGRLLLVNRTQWAQGFRRQLTVDAVRDAQKRQTVVTVSFRHALTERTGRPLQGHTHRPPVQHQRSLVSYHQPPPQNRHSRESGNPAGWRPISPEGTMNAYTSLHTLKSPSILNLTDDAHDDRLLTLVENVSRQIDRFCNRHFYCLKAARLFDGRGGDTLLVPDLISVYPDGLTTDDDLDGIFETTWPESVYLLYPANADPAAGLDFSYPYNKLVVNTTAGPRQTFPARRRTVRAGVSAFGVSGVNAHVVLEGYGTADASDAGPGETGWPAGPSHRVAVPLPAGFADPPADEHAGARTTRFLPLSGKSEAALRDAASRYLEWLEAHAGALQAADAMEPLLGDMAWTAGMGRSHFGYRAGVVFRDPDSLREGLGALAAGSRDPGKTAGDAPLKVVFAFPGRAGGRLPMDEEFYASEPVARAVLNRCDEVFREGGRKSLLDVLFGRDRKAADPTAEGPANYALDCALFALWAGVGIRPQAAAGWDFGELAAAHAAGVFSLEDGLRLAAWSASADGPDGAVGGTPPEELELAPPSIPLISPRSGRALNAAEVTDAEYWRAPEPGGGGTRGCGAGPFRAGCATCRGDWSGRFQGIRRRGGPCLRGGRPHRLRGTLRRRAAAPDSAARLSLPAPALLDSGTSSPDLKPRGSPAGSCSWRGQYRHWSRANSRVAAAHASGFSSCRKWLASGMKS